MNRFEQIAELAGTLFNSEVEVSGGQCDIRKKRVLDIHADSTTKFSCTLDLDISFSSLKDNGIAFNKAEIFLLPDEFSAFTSSLIGYPVSLPTEYRQRLVANPHIICLYIEAVEAPEDFMSRLASAMKDLEKVEEKQALALS